MDRSGWLILRAEGSPDEARPLDCDYAQAFTNPVWVRAGEQPVRSAAAAEYSIRWIDRLRQLAEEWEYWRSDAEKAHVYAQFDEARTIYEGFQGRGPRAGPGMREPTAGNRPGDASGSSCPPDTLAI